MLAAVLPTSEGRTSRVDWSQQVACPLSREFMAQRYIACKAWPCPVTIGIKDVRILWFAVLIISVSGQDNPDTAGFISIDCGARTGHADTRTKVQWMSDTLQIGRSYTLSMTNIDKELQTLQAFPSGSSSVRNCYSLPARSGTAYLVRARFLYGNYDRQSRPPSFSLFLDSTLWQKVDLSSNKAEQYEAITSPERTYPDGTISVCLLRTSSQLAPIINSLELRPLPNNTYVARLRQLDPSSRDRDVNLYLIARVNFGGSFFRSPQDKFDRFWSPFSMISDVRGLRVLTSPRNQTFSWPSGAGDHPPDEVLHTAITSQTISFTLPCIPADPFQAYISLFSCEFSPPPGNRRIEIEWSLYSNERDAYMPFVPNYGSEVILDRAFGCKQYGMGNYTMNSNMSFKLWKNSPSSADPVLNALEMYSIAMVRPGTNDDDVQALLALKKSLNVSFNNWVGDPCFPSPWDELQCSLSSPPRVTSLDLSGMKASGPIPTSIGRLTALERLSLANNLFSGSIPDLSKLQSLSTLNLSSNHLSGMFPSWLGLLPNLIQLDIRNNDIMGAYPHSIVSNLGSNFSFDGNENLCDASIPWCMSRYQLPPSSPREWASPPEQGKKNKTDFILGVGAGILITILVANTLFIIYCIYRCRTPKYHKPSDGGWPIPIAEMSHHGINIRDMDDMVHQVYPTEKRLRAQCYPFNAIKSATNDFNEKLGTGGLGPVYYGVLADGQQVAVKVMPVNSKRETQDILDELDVLSVGLHKNVVPLVGYSQNADEILFLFAYMPEGELQSRLYGPNAASRPLTWKERLRIAVNAAEGLEFLHHTCKPAIIHRNVKSTNIFLSKNLEGKVGHYGVSKLAMDEEGGAMTTILNKTKGYLDPEFHATRELSAKSDIYSFGVLLLEILCGRPPVLDPKSPATGNCSNVVDWVRNSLQKGSVEGIMDPALRGHYNLATAWNVAEIAIHCVEMNSKSRPTMTEVVLDLTRAVDMDGNGELRAPIARPYTNPFIYHSPHNLPAI